MKTIGLIGGMSWESTVLYYRIINQTVNERLGALHSAKILLASVDFEPIVQMQHAGDWDAAGDALADMARHLQRAGADCIVIGANTMHQVADHVGQAVDIPLLHIADATAEAIKQAGLCAVGLLGTRFTMERDFYRARLEQRHGLRVLIPDEADRAAIHRILYEEVCRGVIRDASRETFVGAIDRLTARGAEGIILGCTEIPLLVRDEDADAPLFDTTTIHAHQAVEWALTSNM